MRVAVYEWCCSGGLAGSHPSIEAEGRLMLEAIARDAARRPSLEIVVLVAAGRRVELPPQARVVRVTPEEDIACLVHEARLADWTLVVAPETDWILRDRVRAVRAAGGRVLAPSDRTIEVSSDKQATIDRLAAHGIPVPAGRSIAVGETIPDGFSLPAVCKARFGCGGDGLRVVRSRHESIPPATVASRLELLVAGRPAGVSCLCGPRSTVVLPVMRQRFSGGDAPRYLGSEPLADPQAASRAAALAVRSASAIDADAGWLGVDMILGDHPDGRDDRVLEVNPRPTTSIVGLSGLFASSLVAAMIEAAGGETVSLVPEPNATASAGRFSVADT